MTALSLRVFFLVLFAFSLCTIEAYTIPNYNIPCINITNVPAGCDPRIVRCGTTPPNGVEVVGPTSNTLCATHRIYLGDLYIIQFNDRNKICWEVKLAVGECWGAHPVNGGSYGCMGKCGAGCGDIDCGAWARDCMRHDICSWYFTSTDGANDPNCGDAYNMAENDYLMNRECRTGPGCSDTTLCK